MTKEEITDLIQQYNELSVIEQRLLNDEAWDAADAIREEKDRIFYKIMGEGR